MHDVKHAAQARLLPAPHTGRRPGMIWITLEAAEIIDLKRIVLDRDAQGAVDLFADVILPRVRAAAHERGLAPDLPVEMLPDDGIPG